MKGDKTKKLWSNPRYKKHMSDIHRGKATWNKGKKLGKGFYKRTDYSNLKKYQFKKGEKHPMWKGGKSRDKHSLSDKKYSNWRMTVFVRDGFKCQGCQQVGGRLEAHHIKAWAKYPELRFKVDNGVTLCKDCHKLTNNYGRPNPSM